MAENAPIADFDHRRAGRAAGSEIIVTRARPSRLPGAAALGLAWLLMGAAAAAQPDTMPPPSPTGLAVAPPTLQEAGVLFRVTWNAALDPPGNQPVPIYRWSAGFNDGTGPVQGAVATPLLMLALPYHAKGATSGFVCVLAEDAAGNISPAVTCATLAVPAKPPPPSTTHTIELQEPSVNADGTALKDLASIRIYWRVDNGPESVTTYPVSSPTGGQARRLELTVPAIRGTLSISVTAVDTAGNESGRSATTTKVITPATPDPRR
jgi:hypothetical protein